MTRQEILAELHAERYNLDRAIQALTGQKRRGRPPKNPVVAAEPVDQPKPKRRRKPAKTAKKG